MTACLGLDLSLTSTGFASRVGDVLELGRIRPPASIRDNHRLAWIRQKIEGLIAPGRTSPPFVPYDLIVIEALPSGAHSHFDTSGIAMVHAITRLALFDCHTDATWMAQAKIKLFATGRGNAKKDEVLTAAVRRLGYEGSSNDEADALWLLHMGLVHLGHEPPVPQSHLRALDGVQWVMAR